MSQSPIRQASGFTPEEYRRLQSKFSHSYSAPQTTAWPGSRPAGALQSTPRRESAGSPANNLDSAHSLEMALSPTSVLREQVHARVPQQNFSPSRAQASPLSPTSTSRPLRKSNSMPLAVTAAQLAAGDVEKILLEQRVLSIEAARKRLVAEPSAPGLGISRPQSSTTHTVLPEWSSTRGSPSKPDALPSPRLKVSTADGGMRVAHVDVEALRAGCSVSSPKASIVSPRAEVQHRTSVEERGSAGNGAARLYRSHLDPLGSFGASTSPRSMSQGLGVASLPVESVATAPQPRLAPHAGTSSPSEGDLRLNRDAPAFLAMPSWLSGNSGDGELTSSLPPTPATSRPPSMRINALPASSPGPSASPWIPASPGLLSQLANYGGRVPHSALSPTLGTNHAKLPLYHPKDAADEDGADEESQEIGNDGSGRLRSAAHYSPSILPFAALERDNIRLALVPFPAPSPTSPEVGGGVSLTAQLATLSHGPVALPSAPLRRIVRDALSRAGAVHASTEGSRRVLHPSGHASAVGAGAGAGSMPASVSAVDGRGEALATEQLMARLQEISGTMEVIASVSSRVQAQQQAAAAARPASRPRVVVLSFQGSLVHSPSNSGEVHYSPSSSGSDTPAITGAGVAGDAGYGARVNGLSRAPRLVVSRAASYGTIDGHHDGAFASGVTGTPGEASPGSDVEADGGFSPVAGYQGHTHTPMAATPGRSHSASASGAEAEVVDPGSQASQIVTRSDGRKTSAALLPAPGAGTQDLASPSLTIGANEK